MDEAFWFLADEPIADHRVNEVLQRADDEPWQERMRGDRRITNAPSTDEKKVKRRQIHRSGELEKDAAYGEGSQQPVVPTHKLPSIPDQQVRPQRFLDKLLEDAGVEPNRPPGGFDEPFQQDRYKWHQQQREISRRRKEMPDAEKTPEGKAADMLGDMIGEPGTEREVRDAHNPNLSRDESKHQWFKQRWDQTFEPLGYSEEGKARSRRNTRNRWSKVMGQPACEHPNCPPWEHQPGYKPKYSSKIATVLNTQVERLNEGDQIRTPTGQSVKVHKVRPHETDSSLMYLDTEMGTSTVKRGTDIQAVPYNAQQQELPDTGNPVNHGNTGQLPGSQHGPGGPSGGAGDQASAQTPCPNCGNKGTLHLQGGSFVCSVCGFTVAAGGTPGGMTFTNQPHGYMAPQRKPGEVPKAHVWASKYNTTEGSSQIARRARQVLGGDT